MRRRDEAPDRREAGRPSSARSAFSSPLMFLVVGVCTVALVCVTFWVSHDRPSATAGEWPASSAAAASGGRRRRGGAGGYRPRAPALGPGGSPRELSLAQLRRGAGARGPSSRAAGVASAGVGAGKCPDSTTWCPTEFRCISPWDTCSHVASNRSVAALRVAHDVLAETVAALSATVSLSERRRVEGDSRERAMAEAHAGMMNATAALRATLGRTLATAARQQEGWQGSLEALRRAYDTEKRAVAKDHRERWQTAEAFVRQAVAAGQRSLADEWERARTNQDRDKDAAYARSTAALEQRVSSLETRVKSVLSKVLASVATAAAAAAANDDGGETWTARKARKARKAREEKEEAAKAEAASKRKAEAAAKVAREAMETAFVPDTGAGGGAIEELGAYTIKQGDTVAGRVMGLIGYGGSQSVYACYV